MKLLNKKNKTEIINRLAANEIIFRAIISDSNLSEDKLSDARYHFIENMCEILSLIGNLEDVIKYSSIVNKYKTKWEKSDE